MITIVLFVGGTAFMGTLCYLVLRPLVLEHWGRWQKEREQARRMLLREQRRQALQDEATDSVLKQFARQEETARAAGRKAA